MSNVAYVFMRTDLGMSTGKMIAQAYHLGAPHDGKVVVLLASSEVDLEDECRKAHYKNYEYFYVRDAGRTEIDEGTLTCIAVMAPEGSFPSRKLLSQIHIA